MSRSFLQNVGLILYQFRRFHIRMDSFLHRQHLENTKTHPKPLTVSQYESLHTTDGRTVRRLASGRASLYKWRDCLKCYLSAMLFVPLHVAVFWWWDTIMSVCWPTDYLSGTASNLHAKFHGAILRRILSPLHCERDMQWLPPLCPTEYILYIVVQLQSLDNVGTLAQAKRLQWMSEWGVSVNNH
jgi:hypothetical protein